MSKVYRIVFESIDLDDPSKVLCKATLLENAVTAPTNCLDFSLEQKKQIQLLQAALDNILIEKTELINSNLSSCPKCPGELIKRGKRKSTFHDVFGYDLRLMCRNRLPKKEGLEDSIAPIVIKVKNDIFVYGINRQGNLGFTEIIEPPKEQIFSTLNDLFPLNDNTVSRPPKTRAIHTRHSNIKSRSYPCIY